ncbi:MAG: SRPBCC family protein [Sporomusaceae bacterium]|nr:SRPBCC family protein [Sporomusaceae bacterium]
MTAFRGKRITLRHTMHIAAAPAAVFPLLCPEREKDWIDDWSYEMIYSQSGLAELDCTFKTAFPDEGEAYWVMIRHNPPAEGDYIRFVPGLMIVKLAFVLRPEGDSGCVIEVAHTFTGLSDRGNAAITERIPAEHAQDIARLEQLLDHYARTGRMLKTRQS